MEKLQQVHKRTDRYTLVVITDSRVPNFYLETGD